MFRPVQQAFSAHACYSTASRCERSRFDTSVSHLPPCRSTEQMSIYNKPSMYARSAKSMMPHRISFKMRKTRMLRTLQRTMSQRESTTQCNRIPVAPVFLGVCSPLW
ncbi:hypothetical protein BS17DRAFT_422621 [Gyrodon lividus]|nr:hypothetical protein BS17DRAFT_422621 [Gyrodon lividus]